MPPSLALTLRFPVNILHVHFEVVVPGELLVAQLALRHGPVGVVCQLVSAEHLLQAERQVTHLQNTTDAGVFLLPSCEKTNTLDCLRSH